MAEISKITLPNGNSYDFKDSTARANGKVSGVKGDSESSYRTGNVNITAANVGAIPSNTNGNTQNLYRPNYLNGLTDNTLDAKINTLRANRLAFLPADQIIIEKTTDGGTTWVDAGITDSTKVNLFSETRGGVNIPLLNGVRNLNCGLRITFTAMKYNVPAGTAETQKYNYWNANYVQSTERYNQLKEMYFWLSAVSDTISVKLERATGANSTSWQTAFQNDTWGMTGWSGNDYIRFSQNVFGGGTTQTTNYWNYRLIFMTKGVNGTNTMATSYTTYAQTIMEIRGYGDTWWTAGNEYAANDKIYTHDYLKNVTFPAQVTATQFNGSATKVNNHTVESDVPANAKFTDTTYNFNGTTFYSGNSGNAEHNANNAIKNGSYYYTSNGPTTSLGASTDDGALYTQSYSDSWVAQIAQDYRNGNIFVRGKNNGTWQSWKKPDAGSVNGYTVAKSVPSDAKFTDTVTTASVTGSGNAVTAISASNGAITATKGTTFLTSHQDISGKADKSATVSTVAWDSTNKKLTKTINGTTSDVVTAATLRTGLNIADGAEVNQNAFSNVVVGSTTIAADSKTDTLTLAAGSNVTLTPDATNDKVTIAATDTTYSSKTAASGGTDVSLVTTGEKYTWNNKTSNTGTVTKVTAGTGLSVGSTAGGNFTTSGTINHTNSVTAQTTQAIYPIKIDAQGHISAYGTAVTPLTSHQTIKQDGVTGATVNRYGACSTAAATAAKTVSITTGTFSLETGAKVTVKFTNKNTANSPTLNVNSTGAKNIYHNGAQITSGTNKEMLYGTVDFVYDGTQWQLIGNYVDTNTAQNQNAFSNVKVGSTTIAADTTTDTLELTAGSNITLTPDATNDKVTIAATDTTYSDATTSVHGLMSTADKTKLNTIADYVIETVKTPDGYGGYTKWNSGKLECWNYHNYTVNITTAWGNVYYGTITPLTWAQIFANTNFPGFTGIAPTFTINIGASGGGAWGMTDMYANNTSDSLSIPTIYMIRPTSKSSVTVVVHVHAIGWWK